MANLLVVKCNDLFQFSIVLELFRRHVLQNVLRAFGSDEHSLLNPSSPFLAVLSCLRSWALVLGQTHFEFALPLSDFMSSHFSSVLLFAIHKVEITLFPIYQGLIGQGLNITYMKQCNEPSSTPFSSFQVWAVSRFLNLSLCHLSQYPVFWISSFSVASFSPSTWIWMTFQSSSLILTSNPMSVPPYYPECTASKIRVQP